MEEQNSYVTNQENLGLNLIITKTASSYLTETGKWTKFLSILGFFFAGLIVVMGLFASSMLSLFSGGQMDLLPAGVSILFGGIYILMGLLYFFPAWYLFKFSQKMKLAIETCNNDELTTALGNQKSFFKFWGIVMIVFISIYILMGLFALVFRFAFL